MKKFIFGFILGALVFSSGSVIAAPVIKNLVGQVIDGQFPVKIDGQVIENPAIVTEGTSYLPVRAFAEKAGYKVTFDPEGEIILEQDLSKSQVLHGIDPVAQAEQDAMNSEIQRRNALADIDAKIKSKQGQVRQTQSEIDALDEKIKTHGPVTMKTVQGDKVLAYIESPEYQSDLRIIGEYQQEIDQLNIEIAALEKEKADFIAQP